MEEKKWEIKRQLLIKWIFINTTFRGIKGVDGECPWIWNACLRDKKNVEMKSFLSSLLCFIPFYVLRWMDIRNFVIVPKKKQERMIHDEHRMKWYNLSYSDRDPQKYHTTCTYWINEWIMSEVDALNKSVLNFSFLISSSITDKTVMIYRMRSEWKKYKIKWNEGKKVFKGIEIVIQFRIEKSKWNVKIFIFISLKKCWCVSGGERTNDYARKNQ
jgi:hypothetical protein